MKPAPIKGFSGNGGLRIDIRRYADGRYGFDYTPPGELRVKVRLNNLVAAKRRADELIGTAHAGKLDLLAIEPEEFAEFLRWKAQNRRIAKVPDLVADFLATKKTKGRTAKHIEHLENTLTDFADDFPILIDQIQGAQVERWIDAREVGPRTWNNIRSRIVSLWRFARRRGAIGADETPIEQIELKKTKTKKETYSLEEFKKFLGSVPTEWLPMIINGGFCGVRPEETCPEAKSEKVPLSWEDFLWDKQIIDIKAETSKTGDRRFVPICDAAMEFYAPWRKKKGICVPRMKVANLTSGWGRAIGIPWKFDGWRHSYASYRLAVTRDIAALEDSMGNSRKMIKDHYLDRKHEGDGIAWFSLRPGDVEWVNPKSAALYGREV